MPAPPSSKPLSGHAIGPYRVLHLLGTGGMGEVYLARDERLARNVALKRLRQHLSERERLRLRREALVVAGLSHPSIVRLHEIIEDETGDLLVLEHVEGESVAQALAHSPFPPQVAARLAQEVSEALAEAHGKGIVHRDLKAENVMVSEHGHAKVLDFGLAKEIQVERADDSLTETGTILGTCRSMSPEQAGGRTVDARSDLFSLGVLLYEMLTARSPFRGRDALQTLSKVLTHHPPTVRSLRPEVPEALSTLITRLLAKEPRDRPPSAAFVAEQLERIAAAQTNSDFTDDSFGNAPTGAIVEAQTSAPQSLPPARSHRRAAGAAVALFLTLAALVLFLKGRPVPESRRVVVLPPIVHGEGTGNLDLVSAAILDATLSTLVSLEGVEPVDPSQIAASTTTPVEIVRSLAADEALLATLEAAGGSGRLSLRRIASQGETLQAHALQVPLSGIDLRVVAKGVALHLHGIFPKHPPRGDLARFQVTSEEYHEFLRVKLAVDSGNVSWQEELQRLEEIAARSPLFSEVQLLAAEMSISLFTDTRDTRYLSRAEKLLDEIRRTNPQDLGVLYQLFQLALKSGDRQRAEDFLLEMERRAPHDLRVSLARAHSAAEEGDLAGAITAMRTVVERRPAWRDLYQLATFEAQYGEIAAARAHLEELLERDPQNTWGLGKLVQLELAHGDLERAEALSLDLLKLKKHRSYFTNLGLARFYLGRFEEARESYLEALELAPKHIAVLLNLADTEKALGHPQAAEGLYREVLELLAGQEQRAALSPLDLMTRAQCLVHLGETHRAVEIALHTLRQHGDDADVVYQAALVHTLAGDRTSALVEIRDALEMGYGRHSFEIPDFSTLHGDPDFEKLLATTLPPAR